MLATDHVVLATPDLAARAALSIDNARLYQEAQQQAATHVQLNAASRENRPP